MRRLPTAQEFSRFGDCTCCGAPVSLHYDEGNRRLACEVAMVRFNGEELEAMPPPPQQAHRYDDVFMRGTKSFFERRREGRAFRA
jgi:hypothetical protein